MSKFLKSKAPVLAEESEHDRDMRRERARRAIHSHHPSRQPGEQSSREIFREVYGHEPEETP